MRRIRAIRALLGTTVVAGDMDLRDATGVRIHARPIKLCIPSELRPVELRDLG